LDLSHENVAQDMWRELKIHIYGSMRSAGRVSWIAILGQRGTRNLRRWKVATLDDVRQSRQMQGGA
jgi:hypothetical protein